MSPSSSYQPGFSFLESGSRRGSARSDDDGGGGGGSSIRTARTSASTATRAPDHGGGGSYQHQRTCFPSPSLWRGGPSPKIGGGRKIRRSFSDRLPNNNKPDGGLGKPAHNVLNRGRDLSIRVLKKKMALKVAAAASPQETTAADTPFLPPTASLRKKKNSFVMVFNRITGSRQPKLSIGSGSGVNVAGGPPPSPGGETTDFLKTFCKMSDTDIVNNWLLGIKDSEDKDAVVSSVFAEVAPVPALLQLKNTDIDTTIPSSADLSSPSNAELAGEAGKMAATVLAQSPLIWPKDVCMASELHLDDIRKLSLENVIGIASEVQQDDVTASGDPEDDFIADTVALKDGVISRTATLGNDVITDTKAPKDGDIAATVAPEVAIITDLGTLNNDVISASMAQLNDVIAATGAVTDDVNSATGVLKEVITATGALKDDIVPGALDNDVVFYTEPSEDPVIAATEIHDITAIDLQLDDEMAVGELAKVALKQSLSEVRVQQVASYGVQPFTQQEAEIRELLEQQAQLLVPHDELATLLNTQHNSDPKFTAEGDTLRRRRYLKRRGFAGEDLFRPIQELSFEWGSSFDFDHGWLLKIFFLKCFCSIKFLEQCSKQIGTGTNINILKYRYTNPNKTPDQDFTRYFNFFLSKSSWASPIFAPAPWQCVLKKYAFLSK